MRRKNLISRLLTLALTTVGCLLLALLAPLFLAQRASDEPFLGYSVIASPRDFHGITTPIRLSSAPDLTLNRGALYADGNAVVGTPISRFVLDAPTFTLNASGLAAASGGESGSLSDEPAFIAPLVEPLIAMGFDTLIVRRGTLNITSVDGGWETLGDIQAELSGWRKGQITVRGSFTLHGQRISIDATVTLPGDKHPRQWSTKASLKSELLEAAFEGELNTDADLQLSGQAELASPSLRRLARSFGVFVPAAEGLNAATVRGTMNWTGRTMAVENAKVTVDGNEATGALVLNMTGERPQLEGTLAFGALDLTPYVEAARSQSFVFDRQTASWSAFDLSFPLIKHVDVDLRISAPKVMVRDYGLGRGAATINVRSGKLLAELAELELYGGMVSGQITVDTDGLAPHFALRGKIENLETGAASASLFGAAVLTGRSTLFLDVAGVGRTPAELLHQLSGKATLSLPEGGKLPLDLKAVRAAAKGNALPGWGQMAKGQIPLEPFEAKALVENGVVIGDLVIARAGSTGLAAAGRVDLADHTLDLRLLMKANQPTDRPLKPADVADGEAFALRGPWQAPLVRWQEAGPP
jgi:AsmA protein